MEVSHVVKAGIKGSIAHPESAELIIDLLESDIVVESDLIDYVKRDGSQSVDKINFETNPSLGTLSEGDLYYDEENETLSVNLPDNVKLSLTQQGTFIGQNMSGTTIPKGKVVRIIGTLNLQPRIGLATAGTITNGCILGMTAEDIPNFGKGLVLHRGIIDGIDTDPFFTDSIVYVSDTTPGGLMQNPPDPGLDIITIQVGRILVSNPTTGKIYLTFARNSNLSDLIDVDLISPIVDQVLKYNGSYWTNGTNSAVSAGVGSTFFLDDTPSLPAGSGPQSLEVFSLLKNPSGDAEEIYSVTVNNNTKLLKYFMNNNSIGVNAIDSGLWNFNTYASVSQTTGVSNLLIAVRKVETQLEVLDTFGIGTTRTAFAVGMFSPSDFNSDPSLATYIQTPNALLKIIGYIDADSVQVETLSTYTNEIGVVFSKHINLFVDTLSEMNNTSVDLVSSITSRSVFSIDSTDRLAIAYYAKTTAIVDTTVNLYIKGIDHASYVGSPIAVRHNDLVGLQGGSFDQMYHMTSAEYTVLQNTSGINTGDQDLSAYELNINKSTSVVTDQASNIKYPTVKAVYDWVSTTFQLDLGYTPENVANKATSLVSPDNTKYPTTLAVQNAIDLLPTDHSELTGLGNDDHLQYIRVDGSRAFTNDQSLGNNALTNVSLVNGIVIQTHASRHLPNGADALATGTPSTISTSNTTGTANAFARQDHIHSHGNQTTPSHHAVATTSANGFMSSTDKSKLDTISGTRIFKSGNRAAVNFTGTPRTSVVTFSTAMPDTNYSISITGVDGRTWRYSNKTVNGFTINSGANAALTGEVSWTAISNGETVE